MKPDDNTQANAADGRAAHKMDPGVADAGGESGGGAYPNPHSKTSGDTADGGPAHTPKAEGEAAGETNVGYHGSGKAGDQDYSGEG